jgi:transposase
LSALAQQTLEQKPCDGSAFVFRNASGNRIKVLLWDGNGVWLCQRRLHQGHFIWPKPVSASFDKLRTGFFPSLNRSGSG